MSAPDWRTRRIECAGIEVATFETGSTDAGAPAVVLLHGLGHWTSGAWDRLVPQLDPTWRIVALDLPGFGASGRPQAAYDLSFFASTVAAALAQLVPGRFDLCGHSLGGSIAAELAGRFPERIRRLVLLAPAGFAVSRRQALLVRASPLWTPLAALAPPRAAVAWTWRGAVFDRRALDAAFVERGYAFARERAWRRAYAAVYAGFRPLLRDLPEAQRAFARFTGPVLAVWGERDRYLPVSGAARVPAVYPGAEIAILARAGHLVMVERPAVVGALLREFLNRPPR